jgi:hypothetical protein
MMPTQMCRMYRADEVGHLARPLNRRGSQSPLISREMR